jgi:hypothetical protein
MTGPGKGGDTAWGAHVGRGGRAARRVSRSIVSFSLRLECPRPAVPLLPLPVERDRALIATVTRVAVASLDRQRLGAAGAPAAMAPYEGGKGAGGGANPRST